MSAFRTFSSTQKDLTSSTHIKQKKSKTLYNYTYNELQKTDPVKNIYPIFANKKTQCLTGAHDYESLYEITCGKYLSNPVRNINLDGGNIIFGNFLQFNAKGLNVCEDTKLAYLSKHPDPNFEPLPEDIAMNTWIYPPPPAYAGVPYPDVDNDLWTGMLIIDPSKNVFHNLANSNLPSCDNYSSLEYYQHVDLSYINTTEFRLTQDKNTLQGIQFPHTFKFTKPTNC